MIFCEGSCFSFSGLRGRVRTLEETIHPKSPPPPPPPIRKSIFPYQKQPAMLRTMGYRPGILPKISHIRPDPCENTQNPYEQSRNQLEIPFASIYLAFQGVWREFRHLPKSAMLKAMGYSPHVLLKIGHFRTLTNSPEIHTKNPASSWKSIYKHAGGVSGTLERFPTLIKIRHVQNLL